jgi:hypothetical protein
MSKQEMDEHGKVLPEPVALTLSSFSRSQLAPLRRCQSCTTTLPASF